VTIAQFKAALEALSPSDRMRFFFVPAFYKLAPLRSWDANYPNPTTGEPCLIFYGYWIPTPPIANFYSAQDVLNFITNKIPMSQYGQRVVGVQNFGLAEATGVTAVKGTPTGSSQLQTVLVTVDTTIRPGGPVYGAGGVDP